MPSTTVLAIGLDFPASLKQALENRSLLLTSCNSREEATLLLERGNFDLCIIGKQISAESKTKLVSKLRQGLHPSMPVIAMMNDSGPAEVFGNLTHVDNLDSQLANIRQLLAEITQPASF